MDIATLAIKVDSAPALSGAQNLDTLTVAAGKADAATERLATTSGKVGPALAGAGQNSRMFAMQLSQVAQQGAATGSYMQALAIQAPDLAMGFGAVGIAVGVVASVALPALASAFSSSSAEVDAFKEALAGVTDATATARDELFQLQFGLLSQEEVQLYRELGALVAEQARLREEAVQEEAIVAQYKINQADAMQGQIDAARASLAELKQMQAAIADARNEQDLLVAGLTEAGMEALKLAGVDIASGISAARIEAANLAAELNVALSQAVSIMNLRGSMEYSGRGGDPRDFMEGGSEAYSDGFQPFTFTPPARSGGGGGGGAADQYAAQLEALVTSISTERTLLEEWYAESEAMLMDRRAIELLGAQEHREAMLLLEEEYQRRLSEIEGTSQDQRLADSASFFGSLASIASAGGQKTAKAVAAFQAIEGTVNAYGAAIKALNTPGISLAGRFAAYASVLAAGLKGVAAIRSAGGVGGGGGGAAPTIAAQGVQQAQQQTAVFMVKGLDRDALYSGEMLAKIFDGITEEAQKRGLQIAPRFI